MRRHSWWILMGLLLTSATPAFTQPDVIVLNMGSITKNGTVGDITAYSLSSTSCNIGSQVAIWIDNTNDHPLIGQNIYRIRDGLVEQIGQSWLKHAFCAVNESGCGSCQSTPCSTLGLDCADTYSTGLNGSQSNLGPRYDVNATSGFFNYPFPTQGQTGNAIFKRCQVENDDVDPALNPGAQYFGVVQYITTDEPAFGTQFNNNSYRNLNVGSLSGGGWNLSYSGATVQQTGPIQAWVDHETGVDRQVISTTEATATPGQIVVGTRVEQLGPSEYRYQYVVFNDNSDRSFQSLSIPLPAGILLTDVHFNDVEYHSGEPFDNTDWSAVVAPGNISWSGDTFAQNQNANALRWGTTYSFAFTTNAPPTAATGTLTYFRPGPTSDITFSTQGPSGDFTLPVENLTCDIVGQTVELAWSNAESYDNLEVSRDGAVIATLGGTATSFTDSTPLSGPHEYGVDALVGVLPSGPVPCGVDFPPPLAISFPAGIPPLVSELGDTIPVTITALPGAALDPDSPTLYYDTGAGFVATPLVATGGSGFDATFPAIPCGTEISFYVEAGTETGVVVRDPEDAPSDAYLTLAGVGITSTEDDFEIDSGWSAGQPGDDATTGVWVRVDPNGTTAQPADDHTPAPGVTCWVTGQGSVGGSVGENDVDGGQTTLLSPVFNFSFSSNPTVSYWRWYSNDEGASPSADIFVVEITSNGVDWEEVETVGPTGNEASGGWFFHEFSVASLVALTDTVQLRFIASDEGDGSIVEAAIDDFSVTDVECDGAGTSFSRGDCNQDDGFNITDPIKLLDALFASGVIDCDDACDVDDDGSLSLVDSIYMLDHLFDMGPDPAAPFGVCGLDPTDDDGLECDGFSFCP